MAKYYGKIGFAETVESSPGIWEEGIVEHSYYGEIVQNRRNYITGSTINGTLTINNQISILADAYANQNFMNIRYAEFNGSKWKVESISVERPRLVLTLSSLYDE